MKPFPSYGTLQVITPELLNLIDNQRNSGNRAPGDREALPPAVPEFACISSVYADDLAETESNRRPEWRRGARSRGKRKQLRASTGPLLSLLGGSSTDDLTGTTATSGL
jgi:hypothetical protein